MEEALPPQSVAATSAPAVAQAPAPASDSAQPGATPEEAPKAKTLGPLRMVWREALKYPRQVVCALVALLVTSGSTLGIPWVFRHVIDAGFAKGADSSIISHWFLYIVALVLVLAIGTAVRFYYVSWLGERVVADLRMRVQTNLLAMPPSFFEANSPKEISSRMTADTAVIEQVVGTTVSVALRNAITVIGGVGLLFVLAWKLTLGMVIGIPLIVLPIAYFGRKVRTISRSSQDRVADVGMLVAEVLGAMKVVQAFNQEAREQGRFAAAVERTFETARRRIMVRTAMTAIVILLIFGGLTALLYQGALGVAAGTISGGVIAQFVVTGGLVAGAFGALTEVYGDLLRGAGAAGRLAELMQEEPAIRAPLRPIALPQPPRGGLAFHNVTFRYPSRPEVAALSDFSLTVEPGETVAIVGPSGAGKSTLFLLAERFHDPEHGTVRVDGVPVTQADPADVRRRMALVPQDGTLFAASARDNLRYGKWEASDEEIWLAARAANAEDFLRALPEGLDTFLGEDGARLSGGQRQRIAIARAVLRDSPILLLDEATSALDAESERLVQNALDQLMKGRTTLVIAHRLATIRSADRIVVMDGGRIVEQGTHATLTSANGLYAKLARMQFEGLAA